MELHRTIGGKEDGIGICDYVRLIASTRLAYVNNVLDIWLVSEDIPKQRDPAKIGRAQSVLWVKAISTFTQSERVSRRIVNVGLRPSASVTADTAELTLSTIIVYLNSAPIA